MKLLARFLLCLLPILCTLRAEPPTKPAPVAVLSVNKRVFLDATVRRLDAFTARITHSNGAATVPAWEFSEAQQKSFGFDPAVTAAEHARRVEEVRAAAEAKVDAERLEAARVAAMAAEERVRIERAEKETRARIAAENAVKEDRHTAGAMLNEALKNPAIWQRSDSLKRLHELVAVVVPAYERRSRDLMMAAPGDALAASGWQKAYEQRDCKPYTASEFSVLSQEGKRQIAIFVPELLPGSKLGDLRKEMDELWEKMVAQFTNEVRARRLPLAPNK